MLPYILKKKQDIIHGNPMESLEIWDPSRQAGNESQTRILGSTDPELKKSRISIYPFYSSTGTKSQTSGI